MQISSSSSSSTLSSASFQQQPQQPAAVDSMAKVTSISPKMSRDMDKIDEGKEQIWILGTIIDTIYIYYIIQIHFDTLYSYVSLSK